MHALAFYRLTHGPEGPVALIDAVRSAAAAAHCEQGCRSSRVYHELAGVEEGGGSGGVLLVQEWASTEDLKRHLDAPTFRRVLAVLELSRTPPDVFYVESERLRGIDWIAELRENRNES
jgi:quinol monooxygenase YgiN